MKERFEKTTIPIQSDRSDWRYLSTWSKLVIAGIAILVFILVYIFLSIILFGDRKEKELGVVRTTPMNIISPDSNNSIHPFPDTTNRIHVFNDQLATWEMSEAQFEFASAHYDGTQKVFASDARRLRAHNPEFLVLNYRLGMGLGYQAVSGECEPNGSWLQVIEGEKWIREYPEDPLDEWFYKVDGQRVIFCEWGWYLMDISNTSWREYWAGEVLRQLRTNQADGIFVDGLFTPNFYGGDKFKPKLPEMDQTFENSWSGKVEEFISYGQSGDLSDFHFIANVGQWITGRDITDYSKADGILVEGFARWADGAYFSASEEDWQLQMDRILGMVNLDKAVVLQQYVKKGNEKDRLFILSSYLLIKGNHTFIDMEYSTLPEWFPEYEIPIGSPLGEKPTSISSLWRSDWGVYARNYSEGLVLVNPSDEAKKVQLFQSYYNALPFGGGVIPSDGGTSEWKIDYAQVTSIDLGAHQAAILLTRLPEK